MRLGWRTHRSDSLKLAELHKNWECVRSTQENLLSNCYVYNYWESMKLPMILLWKAPPPLYAREGGKAPILRRPWGPNRYRLVWAVIINPPEPPIIDEARNGAHIASTGMQMYQRTPRVAPSKTKTSDASKSQLNQLVQIGQYWNWLRKAIKHLQLSFNPFWRLSLDRTIWKKVTSL